MAAITSFLALFLLIAFSCLLCVLLHELAHAIPILFFTKGRTTIYIGSFGNPAKCLKLVFGRLDIYCKYNPFSWYHGLCYPPKERLSVNKKILYTSTGPLVSVFITLICWRLTSIENINGFLNFCIYVIFYFSAGISISTILPIQTSKLTYTKSQTINSDGYLILQLLKYSRLPKEYRKSYELIEDKDFANAISLLDGLINKGYTKVHAYRLAVVANIHGKDYIKADKLNKIIKNNFQFNADDYCNAGFINIQNGNIEEGISNCRKSLELNPNHSYSLNNIGYCLGLAGRYEEAINYLNSVIAIAPAFAHPYNNRGFAKLKMGNFEDALLDINHSIQLDDKNAYAYLNLGIYYLSKDELEEAGCLFEKALSIEKDIHVPEEYLLQVKQQRIP